jgi:serine/threonine protein kinase
VVALARLVTQRANASLAALDSGDAARAPTEVAGADNAPMSPSRTAGVGVGDAIDHFQILRPLGAGGMGEVYLAQDTQLDRQVALKLLRPALLHSNGFSQLVDEARATARFNHPNIVTIHHVGLDSARPYLAFEYLPGETLRQRMSRGRLRRAELVGHARAVAGALCEAHGHGLSHRDLKPENIMLPIEGPLRVLDFGLALAAPERSAGSMSEPSGEGSLGTSHHPDLCGTPAYMAPEQWRGGAGPASDIWAFGVLLYELIAGQRPFVGPDLSTLRDQIEGPGPIPALGSEQPLAALTALANDCLQRDVAARPSAATLVERLDAIEAEVRRGRPRPLPGWAGNLLVFFGAIVGYFAIGASVSSVSSAQSVTDYMALALLGLLPAGLAGLMLWFGLRRGRGTVAYFIFSGIALLLAVISGLGLIVAAISAQREGVWFTGATGLYWLTLGAALIVTGVHNIKRRRDDEAYARA